MHGCQGCTRRRESERSRFSGEIFLRGLLGVAPDVLNLNTKFAYLNLFLKKLLKNFLYFILAFLYFFVKVVNMLINNVAIEPFCTILVYKENER